MTLTISRPNYAKLSALAEGKGLDLEAEIAACKEWKANRNVVIKDPYRTTLNWLKNAKPGKTVTKRDLVGGMSSSKTSPYHPDAMKKAKRDADKRAKTETDPVWIQWYEVTWKGRTVELRLQEIDESLAADGLRRATDGEMASATQ